jgi:hypothetical protein
LADGRRVKRLATISRILEELHTSRLTLTSPGIEQYVERLLGPWMLSPDAQKQYVASLMYLLKVEAQSGKRVQIDLSTGGYKLLDTPALPAPMQPVAMKTSA